MKFWGHQLSPLAVDWSKYRSKIGLERLLGSFAMRYNQQSWDQTTTNNSRKLRGPHLKVGGIMHREGETLAQQ